MPLMSHSDYKATMVRIGAVTCGGKVREDCQIMTAEVCLGKHVLGHVPLITLLKRDSHFNWTFQMSASVPKTRHEGLSAPMEEQQ